MTEPMWASCRHVVSRCALSAIVGLLGCTSTTIVQQTPAADSGAEPAEPAGISCEYQGKCPNNGPNAPTVVSECESIRSGPCRKSYEAWLACLATHEVCDAQGKVDRAATYGACSDEQDTAKACVSSLDAGVPTTDGGATTDRGVSPGEVEIVSASLSVDDASSAYLIQFHLKNGTAHPVQAMTSVEVTANYAFPKIDGSKCPKTTSGYPWAVGAGEVSGLLEVSFVSSAAQSKTVVGCTCGAGNPVVINQPFGFDVTIPPVELRIRGLFDDGSSFDVQKTL